VKPPVCRDRRNCESLEVRFFFFFHYLRVGLSFLLCSFRGVPPAKRQTFLPFLFPSGGNLEEDWDDKMWRKNGRTFPASPFHSPPQKPRPNSPQSRSSSAPFLSSEVATKDLCQARQSVCGIGRLISALEVRLRRSLLPVDKAHTAENLLRIFPRRGTAPRFFCRRVLGLSDAMTSPLLLCVLADRPH